MKIKPETWAIAVPRARVTNRTTGPVVVTSRAIRPADRGTLVGKDVDIGSTRGSEMALSISAIANLEGANRDTVHSLIVAGVLTAATPYERGLHNYAFFDVARSLSDYFDVWVERTPPPVTHEEFEAYRVARRRCQIPAGAPHPPRILEAVFQKLLEIGNFSMHEVNGLIPLHIESWPWVKQWLQSRIAEYAREDRRLRVYLRKKYSGPNDVPITWEMFEAGIPAAFSGLPKTCLDQSPRNRRDRPSLRLRDRVWRLTRLFEMGALHALVYAARDRRQDRIMADISAIERIEEIMTAYKPTERWRQKDYAEAIERYAVAKEFLPSDSDRTRVRTVQAWRKIVNRLRRYCFVYDPHGVRGLRKHVPARFIISGAFQRNLTQRYGYLAQETRDDRKQEAHAAFAELDAIYDAATNRRDEMRAFGEAQRAAERDIGLDEPYRDFQVVVPILDDRGRATGGRQVETFRLWRNEMAWRSFPIEGVSNRTRGYVIGKTKLGFADGFAVEHLHTRGIDGAEPITGWMIRPCRLHVQNCPAYLPVSVRAARHAEIRAKGLPGYRHKTPGLLAPGVDAGALARNGLDHGRHFIPLEEVEIAIRFAFVALDTVSQAYSRMQEVLQLVRGDWKLNELVPGEEHYEQEVWPKIEAGEHLATAQKAKVILLAETLTEIFDLCDLHVDRCGLDAFPASPPAPQLRWKCPPAEYVMSWRGQALPAFIIAMSLRYLLAGWPPFTLHDFRHAEAEEAEFDGVSPEVTQTNLGHDNPISTRIYTALPDWALPDLEQRTADRGTISDERRAFARRGDGGARRQAPDPGRIARAMQRRAEQKAEFEKEGSGS